MEVVLGDVDVLHPHLLLAAARTLAEAWALSHPHRLCSADDVYLVMEDYGLCPHGLGPVAGSIFSGRRWELTAYRVKSRRKSNHGREIKVWRFVGDRNSDCTCVSTRRRRGRRRVRVPLATSLFAGDTKDGWRIVLGTK